MIFHRVYNKINTMGATSGAGTAYRKGTHEFTPWFLWGRLLNLVSCVAFLEIIICPLSIGHNLVCLSTNGLKLDLRYLKIVLTSLTLYICLHWTLFYIGKKYRNWHLQTVYLFVQKASSCYLLLLIISILLTYWWYIYIY